MSQVALNNTISAEVARDGLQRWFSAKRGVSSVRIDALSIPSENGLSNETILFDVTWTEAGVEQTGSMVARVEPAGEGLSPTYDIASEAKLLRALGTSGLRVPSIHSLETDAEWLGAPFLVMERLPGRVPEDNPPYFVGGWVFDLAPEDKSKVAENAIAQLAAVTKVDWRELDLGFLDRDKDGATPIERELAYFEKWLAWAREKPQDNPVIDAALAWVRENLPSGEDVVLSWGDSRMGNYLFGDDFDVTGLLDWEFASLGSPELDLGWWIFIQRHFTEPLGLELPEGWPDRDETIRLWEQHSGRRAAHIDFYEIFAGVRFCIMMVRAAGLVKAAGLVPPESTMAQNNPGTQLLASLLGLPAPEGTAEHVVG